jgi:hypothetical protein
MRRGLLGNQGFLHAVPTVEGSNPSRPHPSTRVEPGVRLPGMKRATRLVVLAFAVYTVATKSGRERLKRAREAYSRSIASGSKPIEGVGTAVAAFVGLAESGPLDTP